MAHDQNSSKLKVAGSNPAGVASKINMLGRIWSGKSSQKNALGMTWGGSQKWLMKRGAEPQAANPYADRDARD